MGLQLQWRVPQVRARLLALGLSYKLVLAPLLVAAVYLVVFGVVRHRVYQDLDTNLRYEAARHLKEVSIAGSTIRFSHMGE